MIPIALPQHIHILRSLRMCPVVASHNVNLEDLSDTNHARVCACGFESVSIIVFPSHIVIHVVLERVIRYLCVLIVDDATMRESILAQDIQNQVTQCVTQQLDL